MGEGEALTILALIVSMLAVVYMDEIIHLSIVAERMGVTNKTVYSRIGKSLPPAIKKNGNIVGLRLKDLESIHSLRGVFTKADCKPDRCLLRKKKKRKLTIYKRNQYKGYLINCANCKPCWKEYLDKIYDSLIPSLERMKLPLGIIVTITDKVSASQVIQRFKRYLASSLGIKPRDIFHIRKNEDAKDLGEHCHVVFWLDAFSLDINQKQMLDIIYTLVDIMGYSFFVELSKKKHRNGIHMIKMEQDKSDFIYHVSYLAKLRTSIGGMRAISSSRFV